MNVGERTKRNPDCFIAMPESPWFGIGKRLFQGGGFGVFCGGYSAAAAISCVLDRGGLLA